jgi:glycosyltransferase involved in cell wall biosynthesis
MSFFSVIIPLYNKENYVENTLKSIISQTFTDYEVLIINDFCTDASVVKVTPFLSEKIRLIHHDNNKGLSATRNTGIKNAKSEYVAFLDADDLWKPTFLETIKSLVEDFEEAALFGTNYEEIYANKKTISTALNLNKNQKNGIIADFFEVNLQQPIYCPSSLCVRKKAIETIGFYDETITYSEDVDFNIRANLSFKLAYSSEILVQGIKLDANRITNTGFKDKKIPDLNSYEHFATGNKSLKKYLDINRYIFANNYKREKDLVNFRILKNGIHPNPKISGLNIKQRILLELPSFFLVGISKLKLFFQKKGIQFSSFSK